MISVSFLTFWYSEDNVILFRLVIIVADITHVTWFMWFGLTLMASLSLFSAILSSVLKLPVLNMLPSHFQIRVYRCYPFWKFVICKVILSKEDIFTGLTTWDQRSAFCFVFLYLSLFFIPYSLVLLLLCLRHSVKLILSLPFVIY